MQHEEVLEYKLRQERTQEPQHGEDGWCGHFMKTQALQINMKSMGLSQVGRVAVQGGSACVSEMVGLVSHVPGATAEVKGSPIPPSKHAIPCKALLIGEQGEADWGENLRCSVPTSHSR